MIVSNNNNLLNILLPNDNKVLKEALKNADSQTLQKFQNGTATVGDVLKNLFEDLKSGDKNKATIENILKNSNIFKMDQNFSKSIESLLAQLKSNPSLEKFSNQIETILKNITNLDENTLKEMINKSGVFLESKVLNQLKEQTTLPKNLTELLTQIKTIIKEIPNPDAKKIDSMIDKLLQTNPKQGINLNTLQNELKQIVSNLQNLLTSISSKQMNTLSTLTQKLENLSSQAQLVESKITNTSNPQLTNELINNKNTINTKTLELLTTLKQELVNIKGIDTKPLNQLIDKLLNLQNLFSKIDLPSSITSFQSNFASNIDSLLTNLKTATQNLSSSPDSFNLHQNINKTIQKLETIINNIIKNPNILIQKEQNTMQNDMKALLLQVSAELASKVDSSSQETLKQIDRMITQIEYHQLQSIVTNSNSVYIPFLWDMLDEGTISMKKVDEEKFYCEINLSLKEFGDTNLLLALYDKNKLDLTIFASKESFKETIKQALPKLRESLNKADLIPANIKIIQKKEEETKEQKQMDMFNQNSFNTDYGVNIRV